MTTSADDRFDAALRSLHMQATSHVSAGTMAQLHQRRHAALDGTARRRSLFGWPVATAFASVLAVAIGLGIGLQDGEVPAQATPAVATATTPDDLLDADALATFDENPELFLWLASSDATLLAME